ncbi:signal recognition particle-docking protein FtsY [archaeon 13_1_40CM_4_53_4]|nr:MAG: signal recognition particle-docking protein FtsY [archaeon 13_2_20CM_2_53_6]OLC61262.1 MAG: signal recognition particle-docking protein FtsY [archaeon 13_1_40CM_4_53_4]OLE58394.1 MAG: signal recognition particle-docking protein FtsY [Crenarchaeota archaeon 13_1_20CM_2_53_14]TMI25873.1 MAG: signal recognition particle-docking protein FtsY [Candidatus Bathyarchaeota archaeon]
MFDRLRAQFSNFYDRIATTELKGKDLENVLDEFQLSLIENDVAVSVAESVSNELKEKLKDAQFARFTDPRARVRVILQGILLSVLERAGSLDIFSFVDNKKAAGEPAIIVFIGINGTGKTTSIAKLAYILQKKKRSVILAASDTYRSGSIEQLEEHARRVGVRLIKHQYGADPAAVAFDAVNYAKAHSINAVLIDTAGRMQTNKNLLEEMRKIVRVTNPDLTILVVDALTGNDAVEQGKIFSEAVKIDGIILAKLDADVKGGSAISLSYIMGKPIALVGTGQKYDDLEPFQPESIVKNIMG